MRRVQGRSICFWTHSHQNGERRRALIAGYNTSKAGDKFSVHVILELRPPNVKRDAVGSRGWLFAPGPIHGNPQMDEGDLRKMVLRLDLVHEEGGETFATSITYAGLIEILAVVRKGLSLSLNFLPRYPRRCHGSVFSQGVPIHTAPG
ncbi:MAG: hypothetical protein M1812_006860 [Candelaria pacifica]|nr:MAG: hypothetical protein M1812_006860 [Candelaria pacifica]